MNLAVKEPHTVRRPPRLFSTIDCFASHDPTRIVFCAACVVLLLGCVWTHWVQRPEEFLHASWHYYEAVRTAGLAGVLHVENANVVEIELSYAVHSTCSLMKGVMSWNDMLLAQCCSRIGLPKSGFSVMDSVG